MNSQNTSDLIYLFVDGEADDVQKTQLFSALANDSDLQAELSDAIRINAAAREEAGDTTPPGAVTTALFETAGIGTAASSVGSAIGGASATAGRIGAGALLVRTARRVALPFTASLLGVIAAFLLFPGLQGIVTGDSDGSSSTSNGAHAAGSAPNQILLEERGFHGQASPIVGGMESGGRLAQGDPRASGGGAESAASGFAQRAAGRSTVRLEHDGTPTTRRSVNRNQVIDNDQNRFGKRAISSTTVSSDALVSLSSSNREGDLRVDATEATPQMASLDETAFDNASRTRRNDFPETDDLTTLSSGRHLSFQVQGLIGLDRFPQRDFGTSPNEVFGNLAATLFWNVDDNHAIGIEAGREEHPIYVYDGTNDPVSLSIESGQPELGITINGNGDPLEEADLSSRNLEGGSSVPDTIHGYRLKRYQEWGGVSYRYRGNSLFESVDVRPFGQAMVGASSIGPIGRADLGVAWKPDGRVSIGASVEGTGMLYRDEGTLYSTRKLGLSYFLEVDF